VTAEGIECAEQLALLSDLSPIYLQGFLLARPVPADQVLSLMATLPDHLASLFLTTSGEAVSQRPSAHKPTIAKSASRGR
jgi:hypothetical protein